LQAVPRSRIILVNETRSLGEAPVSDAAAKIRNKLQEAIDEIDRELKTELPRELKAARAHGDLSENAEFKFAKQRQHLLESRLAQLRHRLAELSLLNLNNIPRDRVGFGSQVTLVDVARDAEVKYKLVHSEEADVARGLISTTSPIGRGLMGKRVGDTVSVQTPAGPKEFEIVDFATIHDEAF